MSLRLEWSNEQDKVEIPESFFGRLEQLLQLAGEAEGITDGEVMLSFIE